MQTGSFYKNRVVLITGGAGFIGCSLSKMLSDAGAFVVNIDSLTYASNPAYVAKLVNHTLVAGSICDTKIVSNVLKEFKPQTVFHLAAESHVDRSINNSAPFIDTNIVGTSSLLEKCLEYYQGIDYQVAKDFRFIHVSTDEVFGSLKETGTFDETSPYMPNSPYSASKAAADHLVRAWHITHGLPVCISNCSNNFGPRQNSEKLIPTIVHNALAGKPIPIYGNGMNVRDWLFVEDHCDALMMLGARGVLGSSYCIGGGTEETNLSLAKKICSELDRRCPTADGQPHSEKIEFVVDRKGHDFRYSINSEKIVREVGWKPKHNFESALVRTIDWLLNNVGEVNE